MFIDESAFDEIDEIKVTSKFSSRPSTAVATQSNSNTLRMDEMEENEDELPAFRSAGTLSTPNSSRARMLAQQREIAMKKRQTAMQSGGMVRSSIDSNLSNSPAKSEQFTPAVRQFSAPKSVKDVTESTSEFNRPAVVARPVTSSASKPASNRRTTRYSDDDEEDDDSGYARNTKGKGNTPKSRGNNRDDYEDYEDTRRGMKDMRMDDRGRNNRNSRRSEEDDYDDRNVRNSKNNKRDDSDYDDRNRTTERNNRWETSKNRRNDDSDRDRNDPYVNSNNTSRNNNQNNNPNNRNRDDDRQSNNNTAQEAIPRAAVVIVPPDLSNMRKFLLSPVPKNCGVIQCYIRRNKSGTNKLFPIYSLYLKEGDLFLMASRKRAKNKTSNYLISMDQNDMNRNGNAYLGKLRANFIGTEFMIFDDGVNPKESEGDDITGSNSNVRCEMGSVMYAANVLGSRGPRKMQVACPAVDETQGILKWKDGNGPLGAGDDMLTRMKERNFRDLVYLINKPPRWNEQVGAYVLNFNGRVTMASVKNFQLVDPEEQNAVVLQFGRVGKDEFTMDLQYPMSPFQAFAITLSSFDSKIACD